MPGTVAETLIRDHLVEGEMVPGEEMGLRVDQTLTQDATGTMVMLELEAMGIDRVRTELSAQYVDHNLLQQDNKNPDDHLFLRSACRLWSIWYSRPGNGVSHPVHMERFGVPGKTLLGSDSHTPAAGALGMLAMGSGGIEVAMAMAGQPYYVKMPETWGVHLTGELPDWVSAKDVVLEMLRRHDVDGGVGRIVEYHGPGLDTLSAWDRHVIANMGTELGATTTVFPADREVQRFMERQGRGDQFVPVEADPDASYDIEEEIDLSELEPLIAKPVSPGNVVPVADLQGDEIYQAYIGSSANPGLRDYAVPALMVDGLEVPDDVSLDVNPSTRQVLVNLSAMGHLGRLACAGARIHQAGCNGCIGMGQAPATDQRSLRTVPRNFPGRSGTKEDRVYLCSPETATASALTGEITDPRTLDMDPPRYQPPEELILHDTGVAPPAGPPDQAELRKGPNIAALPAFEPVPAELAGPVMLKVHDDVSTDEIMPAGGRALPFRSNLPKIARFTFDVVDEGFYERAINRDRKPFMVVAGENYGQGSSREHAALAPYYLGLRAVLAKSYARIHWQNLINFGIVPLTFDADEDYIPIDQMDVLRIPNVRQQLQQGPTVRVLNESQGLELVARHQMSQRQVEVLLSGGLINAYRQGLATPASAPT